MKLVVKKPSEKTDDGAGSGGGYWYPKDGRYDHEPERIIVREVPDNTHNQCPVPVPQPAPQLQPRDTREQPPVVPAHAEQGFKRAGSAHAAGLPQTSDKGVASSAAELLAASFGALGALAFTRRRKQRKQNGAHAKDVNEDS